MDYKDKNNSYSGAKMNGYKKKDGCYHVPSDHADNIKMQNKYFKEQSSYGMPSQSKK